MAQQNYVVGVDLGGTNVRSGVFDQNGHQLGQTISRPSHGQDGVKVTLSATIDAIKQAISTFGKSSIAGLGLAVPGHVDDDNGLVRWAPNLGHFEGEHFVYWQDVQVRKELESVLNLPVSLGNDANLAALAEYRYGSGENKAACLVMLTVGTGIGGGVVFGAGALLGDVRGTTLLLGSGSGGAELGHILVQHGGLDCKAGSYGSLEAYCQKESILRRAQNKLSRGRESVLREWLKKDVSSLSLEMLSQAADQGDRVSLEVWKEVGEYLGAGIGSLINTFAPDVVAIGGQIAKAGELLLSPARHSAQNVAIPTLFEQVRIVQATRLEDAGILGAASLAISKLN